MTEDERKIMLAHREYLQQHFDAGTLLLFGGVYEEGNPHGIALLDNVEAADVDRFIAEDPSVIAGLNRYTYAPMMLGGIQGPRS